MAVQCSEASDRVSVTSAIASMSFGFTVAGWFRNDSDQNNNATYARFWIDTTTTTLTVATMPDGTTPAVFTSGGTVTALVAPPLGEWWYLAVSVLGTTATLYAIAPDGTVSSLSGTISTNTGNGMTLFGRHPAITDEPFIGSAAYVRAWQKDLTLAELQAERTHDTAVRTAQIWGDWPLDTADDLTDHSGQGHHLIAGTTALATVTGPTIAAPVNFSVTLPALDAAATLTPETPLAFAKTLPSLQASAALAPATPLVASVLLPALGVRFADRPALRVLLPALRATTGVLGLIPQEEVELAYQRRNTLAFIEADPVDLALIPATEVRTPSGGVLYAEAVARPVQRFRLIPMSHTERPERSSFTTGGSAGVTRKHDFTLLAPWDAIIDKKDFWIDEAGRRYDVDALIPDNGYQRKALVTLYRGPAS